MFSIKAWILLLNLKQLHLFLNNFEWEAVCLYYFETCHKEHIHYNVEVWVEISTYKTTMNEKTLEKNI